MNKSLSEIVKGCPKDRVPMRHPETGRVVFASPKTGEVTNYKCFGFQAVEAPAEVPEVEDAPAAKPKTRRRRSKKVDKSS